MCGFNRPPRAREGGGYSNAPNRREREGGDAESERRSGRSESEVAGWGCSVRDSGGLTMDSTGAGAPRGEEERREADAQQPKTDSPTPEEERSDSGRAAAAEAGPR